MKDKPSINALKTLWVKLTKTRTIRRIRATEQNVEISPKGADLSKAHLKGADLMGAHLKNVKNPPDGFLEAVKKTGRYIITFRKEVAVRAGFDQLF